MVDWIIRKISANGCQKWILKKPYICFPVCGKMAKKTGSEWITRNISQVDRLMAANPLTNGSHRAPPAPGKLCGWGRQGPEVLTDLQELQRKMQGEYQTILLSYIVRTWSYMVLHSRTWSYMVLHASTWLNNAIFRPLGYSMKFQQRIAQKEPSSRRILWSETCSKHENIWYIYIPCTSSTIF